MNRLFKDGIVTTLIGVLIVLGASIVWIFEARSAEECMVIAGLGLTFLRSKDSLIGLKQKGNERNEEQ